MKKVLFVTVLLLSFGLLFSQQDKVGYYIELDDASGMKTESYQTELEEAAEILALITDGEKFPQSIKVYDFGYYLYHGIYEQDCQVLWDKQIASIPTSTPHYVIFGKESNGKGVYSKITVKVSLPELPNTCYGQGEFEKIAQQILDENYNGDPNRYAAAIVKSIEGLTEVLSKALFCCVDSSKQNKKDLGSCTACALSKSDVTSQLKRMQFAEYESLNDVFVSDNGHGYEVRVPDGLGNTVDLVSEVDGFVRDLEDSGYNAALNVLVFDFDECGDLLNNNKSVLAELEDSLTYLSNNEKYHERIIIIKEDSAYFVFYRFDYTNDFQSSGIVCSNNKSNSKILPAIAARWVVKRALMASAGVMLDIGVSIVMEYFAGDHESWGEAWDHTELHGWQLFWAGIEGAVGDKYGDVAAIGGGFFIGTYDYFKNTEACAFTTNGFFDAGVQGMITSGTGVLLGKFAGKLLSAAVRNFPAERASELANLLLTDVLVKKDFFASKLLGKFKMKSWQTLVDFPSLRTKISNLDLIQKFKAEFGFSDDVISREIRDASEGTTKQIGLYRYCINGLGCFVEDTPILMASNPFKNVAPAMALAAMPLITPIQHVQVDDMVKAYHHEEMYLTAYIDVDDVYVPGWQDYDYLIITPETWQVGKFIITEEDGSVVEIEANRPKKWFEEQGVTVVGNSTFLIMSEFGVYGNAQLLDLKPTHIDTRNFALNENGKVDRPVITTFKRIANEISDYTFSNGQVISCTPNHPFYSSDRQAYIPVGELTLGESVLTAGEREIKFIAGKSRDKGEHVYNFEVWREHNYYVGIKGSYDFVLAHNACWSTVDELLLMSKENRDKILNGIWDNGVEWIPGNKKGVFGRGSFMESLLRDTKYKSKKSTGSNRKGLPDDNHLGNDQYPTIDFVDGDKVISVKTTKNNNPYTWVKSGGRDNLFIEKNIRRLLEGIRDGDIGDVVTGVKTADLDIYIKEFHSKYPKVEWVKAVNKYIDTLPGNLKSHRDKLTINVGTINDAVTVN